MTVNLDFNKDGLPFDYWDVRLTEEGYNSIEVTIGSKMTAMNQNRTITLMHRFFPNDAEKRFHYSELKIK